MPKITPFTLQSNGKQLDLSTPVVMAILNLTPDSFYDGGSTDSIEIALEKVNRFITEGASIVDIGGMSSRPGAKMISSEEELDRILPTLLAIVDAYPNLLVSVDTFHAETAAICIENGCSIINDISGSHFDSKMVNIVANSSAIYVAMHMRGTPETMQSLAEYRNVAQEVNSYFKELIDSLPAQVTNRLVIDPGFGFAKTIAQNFELLNNLEKLQDLAKPILVGISRKSMIWRTLKQTPEDALNGTSALHMVALQKGANILRVHDVKEAIEVIELHQHLH